MPVNRPSKRQLAAFCTAAAMVCAPLAKASEGEKLRPYRDPAGIVTWCDGETQGPHKALYTSAECTQLLSNRLAKKYAPAVARCLPELATSDRIKAFAAFLDAQYNTWAACRSPMAHEVHLNHLKTACNGFTAVYDVEGMRTPGWFTTARFVGRVKSAAAMRRHGWTWTGRNWRKILPGLVTRRHKERELCLQSVAA